MTNTKRWLDELPLGSGERELLLVGKAARPAEGAIDANWQALCAALGTTAISGTFATSAAEEYNAAIRAGCDLRGASSVPRANAACVSTPSGTRRFASRSRTKPRAS